MPTRVEEILKQIHILFAKGETYQNSPDLVILSKTDMFALLQELNEAMYEVLDQYEATTRSKEMARLETAKFPFTTRPAGAWPRTLMRTATSSRSAPTSCSTAARNSNVAGPTPATTAPSWNTPCFTAMAPCSAAATETAAMSGT